MSLKVTLIEGRDLQGSFKNHIQYIAAYFKRKKICIDDSYHKKCATMNNWSFLQHSHMIKKCKYLCISSLKSNSNFDMYESMAISRLIVPPILFYRKLQVLFGQRTTKMHDAIGTTGCPKL